MKEPKVTPKIAAAVGVAAKSSTGDVGLAKRIEQAMSKAAADAQAKGIVDPAEIRKRMMAAREAAKQLQ